MTLPLIYQDQTLLSRIATLLWYTLPLESDEDIMKVVRTSNQSSFNETMFEKDFYLTTILHYLSKALPEITFKGWTCLNKVYFPYFRLSEDLDFMMATKNSLVDSNRKRQIFAYKMREAIQQITTTLGRTLNPDHLQHKKAQGNKNLKKKEYTYLKYLLTYPSLIDHSSQHIKIELTYTEYIYFPAQQGTIQSLFKDPIFEQPIFPETTIRCYALEEMMSEKMRACLSRRKPAIRDFYDLRYVQQQGLDLLALKPIVQKKLTENEGWFTIDGQFETLQAQIETGLKPMLWSANISFNLKQIYDFVLSFK